MIIRTTERQQLTAGAHNWAAGVNQDRSYAQSMV
jgi:hypothetical protein